MYLRDSGRCAVAFILLYLSAASSAAELSQEDAVALSRDYLAASRSSEREGIAAQLQSYRGLIEPVLQQLQRRTYNRVKSGYLPDESFSIPELDEKHPNDLLFFNVPPNYTPKEPHGLIVFLHGGGATTGRRAPRVTMNYPEAGVSERDSGQMGTVFNAAGLVAVGPSAPWNENSYYRWCLRESDEYIADVIRECQSRFNIDPDRVILLGHSMGGFGAYHHALRQPDRFSTVIAHAGSWSRGFLPAMRGTPLCIVQGINDARDGARWHYTDIEYARETVKLLTAYKLEHRYYEHDGMHALSEGKEYVADYLKAAKNLRRDAYTPRVTLATPAGYSAYQSSRLRHNRWLTINAVTPGTIPFDQLVSNGEEDFHRWKLSHERVEREGSLVDAMNYGGNLIAVNTQHVSRFTVWLHPRMIDISKPVQIHVNQKPVFKERVTPTLVTALDSYRRRGDWGLIYPIKVEIDVP
ncbi:alpha/beta fold hydrolase [Anatilimnocola floriformis]|uniref:alpha/beta fold hydrolase n=1 Tax=Anatilimnocola floriformis TaxID=2948575 RepID=UPI0020C44A44|nr:alpha/beta fold hydrolase [Anatilimnocola floriformis]